MLNIFWRAYQSKCMQLFSALLPIATFIFSWGWVTMTWLSLSGMIKPKHWILVLSISFRVWQWHTHVNRLRLFVVYFRFGFCTGLFSGQTSAALDRFPSADGQHNFKVSAGIAVFMLYYGWPIHMIRDIIHFISISMTSSWPNVKIQICLSWLFVTKCQLDEQIRLMFIES